MNKHEEVKKIFDKALYYEDKMTGDTVAWYLSNKGYKIKNVDVYIKQAEATEKRLQDLKRDVKRYRDIRTSCPKGMSIDDWKEEREALEIRLAKVGKE